MAGLAVAHETSTERGAHDTLEDFVANECLAWNDSRESEVRRPPNTQPTGATRQIHFISASRCWVRFRSGAGRELIG